MEPSNSNLAAHWMRAGPLLEEVGRQELREFKHEDNMAIIDALLQIGFDRSAPAATSGLVEMVRLLARTRP